MDRYTRFLLTVIAIALTVIAARGISPVAPAYAADTIECRFDGPLTIGDFRDQLDVRVEQKSYQPGSSSGNPLYVRTVD